MLHVKTALLSVWDKTGVVELATTLAELGIVILSTGGTAKKIKEAGIPLVQISDYTNSKELLGGRVKTLHPKIHAGLLALRDNQEHMETLRREGIRPIDMVVVNLYPFRDVIGNDEHSFDTALAHIDIGGPCMLRAGAKNFKHVAVVSNPHQYQSIIRELRESDGTISKETCASLAQEVFETTSYYDSIIAQYLQQKSRNTFPQKFSCAFHKAQELRYGENPHQKAAFYHEWNAPSGSVPTAHKIAGNELSFNNLLDFEAARRIAAEFNTFFCVVIKHNNPCGAGEGNSLLEACTRAVAGDPMSAFGSIVGVNRPLEAQTAKCLAGPDTYIQGIIAPEYTDDALAILKETQPWGKRLIILKSEYLMNNTPGFDFRRIAGGLLVQEQDMSTYKQEELQCVTDREPTPKERLELDFAWKICKHVKSNAIVLSRDRSIVGVGAGQMSRIDAAHLAIRKAAERCKGSVMASDAFLPFPDVVDATAMAGVTAIIQPGGSLRDKNSIEAANRHNMVMLFTGMRHFLH